MKEIEINLDPVRGHVAAISRALPVGAAFGTIAAKDADKDYEKKKAALAANPTSPVIKLNRSPRWIELRVNSVIDQKFTVDIDGTKQVVFNAGTDSEAKATVVDGNDAGIFQTTDEAVKDALRGQSRVFADIASICARINSVNEAEKARLEAVKRNIESMIDSITSAINSNKNKVQKYQEQMGKYKPAVEVETGASGPVHVIVS